MSGSGLSFPCSKELPPSPSQHAGVSPHTTRLNFSLQTCTSSWISAIKGRGLHLFSASASRKKPSLLSQHALRTGSWLGLGSFPQGASKWWELGYQVCDSSTSNSGKSRYLSYNSSVSLRKGFCSYWKSADGMCAHLVVFCTTHTRMQPLRCLLLILSTNISL